MNYSGNSADFATLVRPTACGPKPSGRISRNGEVSRVSNLNLAGGRGTKKKRSSTPRALFSFVRRHALLGRRDNCRHVRAGLAQVS
jgi:hypothetical protein